MPHIHDKIDFTVEVFIVYNQKNFLKNPLLPPKGGSLIGDFSYTWKFLGFSKEPPPKGGGFQPFENNKVLLRKHDKYKLWMSIGGHNELNEDPN